MTIDKLFGIELPIIQAPMAGSQGSALALAVSNAGGLGSQPCAMLGPDQIRNELQAITAATPKPYNVNFFVHKEPRPDPVRDDAWRKLLAPYFAEHDIDPASIQAGPQRLPFDDAVANVLEEFRPPIVSFHFGLPSEAQVKRVKSWG
jgi:nitronate monooxygenase